MRLLMVTKHFGFHLHNHDFYRHVEPRWYTWSLRIGFSGNDDGLSYPRYRYELAADFQLIPNFYWYRTVIEHRRDGAVVVQDRIVGIQDWPWWWSVRTPKPSKRQVYGYG